MIECICSFEEEYGFLKSETMNVISELIRCKDCRFSHITADGLLNKHCDNMTDDDGNKVELYVESTFYCGWAERKEE